MKKKYTYLEIGRRLKDLRKSKKNLSQENFAKLIGLHLNTYRRYETGERLPPESVLERIAKECGTTVDEILGRTKFSKIKEVRVPVVMRIGAAEEVGRTYFEPYEPPYEMAIFKDCKAALVDSDSMAPVAYKGQLVIFSEIDPIRDGDLVVVKLKDGRQLFKRYYEDKVLGLITLVSTNHDHQKPINVKKEDLLLCGKVVGVRF